MSIGYKQTYKLFFVFFKARLLGDYADDISKNRSLFETLSMWIGVLSLILWHKVLVHAYIVFVLNILF